MEADSGSSQESINGRSSLCGLGGGRKSSKKESKPNSRKSFKSASGSHVARDSPTAATSPASTSNTSSNKSPSSSGKDGTKTKSGIEKASSKQNRSGKKLSLAARTRSFFHLKEKSDSPTAESGVGNEQGSSENVALLRKTSPASDSKLGDRGTVSEIKRNTVAERRAAFENLAGEQPSRPTQEQPSAKTGQK